MTMKEAPSARAMSTIALNDSSDDLPASPGSSGRKSLKRDPRCRSAQWTNLNPLIVL